VLGTSGRVLSVANGSAEISTFESSAVEGEEAGNSVDGSSEVSSESCAIGEDGDGSGDPGASLFSCSVPKLVVERCRFHTLFPRPPRPPRTPALPASVGGALAQEAARLRTEGPNTLVFKTRSRPLNTSLDATERSKDVYTRNLGKHRRHQLHSSGSHAKNTSNSTKNFIQLTIQY